MRTRLALDYHFEAAHFLPKVPDGHKCKRMHGHSYTVVVTVEGDPDPDMGWVIDFGDIKSAFKPLEEALDHRYLNEIEGLDNPTSENLAIWIWQRLKPELPALSGVVVHETCTSGCVYRGPV